MSKQSTIYLVIKAWYSDVEVLEVWTSRKKAEERQKLLADETDMDVIVEKRQINTEWKGYE